MPAALDEISKARRHIALRLPYFVQLLLLKLDFLHCTLKESRLGRGLVLWAKNHWSWQRIPSMGVNTSWEQSHRSLQQFKYISHKEVGVSLFYSLM